MISVTFPKYILLRILLFVNYLFYGSRELGSVLVTSPLTSLDCTYKYVVRKTCLTCFKCILLSMRSEFLGSNRVFLSFPFFQYFLFLAPSIRDPLVKLYNIFDFFCGLLISSTMIIKQPFDHRFIIY